MSKELREQFTEEKKQTWHWSYLEYIEWLESKLKEVEKIANGSYSTFGKGDYELGYESGIEATLELIKEAIK